MAASVNENVRQLLTQYVFEIDNEIKDKMLTCILCTKIIKDVYQTYCGCNYCYECICDYLTTGHKYCLGGKKECEEEHLALEVNVFNSPLLNRKISKVKVTCPNDWCTHKIELAKLEDHLRVCSIEPSECPYMKIGCIVVKGSSQNLLDHFSNEQFNHSGLILEHIQNMKNEMEILKSNYQTSKLEIKFLRAESIKFEDKILLIMEELKRKEERILTLEEELRNKEKDDNMSQSIKETNIIMKDLQQTIERIETKAHRNHILGVLLFTVDKFSIRKTKKENVLSPLFYSHINGYKLRLSVHPGGLGDNNTAHLSLFLIICKGEYDDLLSWPCMCSFEIGIINQKTDEMHKSLTLRHLSATDNVKCVFNKPIDKDNFACGHSKFILQSDLNSIVGLVVEESIIIKCSVIPPP